MDAIFERFDQLWRKSLLDPSDKSTISKYFFKARLDAVMYQDMIDFLKDEFYQSTHNVFDTHLYLVDKSLKDKDCPFKYARAAFLNQAFVEFYNQMKNQCKRKTKLDSEISKENKDNSSFKKTDQIILKAFELAAGKNMSMLSSFNKIYNFNENLDKLNTDHYLEKINFTDKAIMIGELQLHDNYQLDKIVIPLMLLDKYTAIDDYINKSETVTIQVVDLCDKLCSPDVNLKDIANDTYEHVQRKKIDRFKAKNIAKYASSILKRIKKINLISVRYQNIGVQLKISQMRFLVNLRYDNNNKRGSDPISFDAWIELIMDLIGNDDILKHKLFLELIQYQKDIETAQKFLDLFNYDLNKLPESLIEFYTKNIEIINNNEVTKKNSLGESESTAIEKLSYYPNELLNEANIKFVDSPETFSEMLSDFENFKPKVIGLDCEWKPSFDLIDTSNENDKKNRASTLQIATRERVYIIDVKFLIEKLSEKHINKFGDLILFNENLMKLGYSFQQDAKKLSLSFPCFIHRFSEFEEDVLNIDEIVSEFQKKWTLFPNPIEKDKDQRQSKGLSELTRKCFGAPLNKSECLSNWDRRPLRLAQLKYGALDAFVLIQIHDYVQERCKTLGIDFEYSSKKNFF